MTRLFVTDLDQTFLNSERQFNVARFTTILNQLDERGDQFAIATGRDENWVRNKFGKLVDRMHLVTGNGATWRVKGSEQLHVRNINASALKKLEDILTSDAFETIGVIAFSADNMYNLAGLQELPENMQDYMAQVYPNMETVAHLTEIPELLTSVTGIFPPIHSEEAIALIDDNQLPLHATTSGYGTVDILAEGVNKATSLTMLIDQIDLAPEDLTVFGDGMNDLEMMQLAGNVYIMPNSDDRLFGRGYNVVTNDSDHDGVLETLEKIM
ncbi:HAD-IIB family hydrolase [Weissella paramesenteroides]|uniref:HAD-IIB family hydrolase n=1 Tax=Weissella paramesenteroides TaxID=1249 RepID=UPI003F7445E2